MEESNLIELLDGFGAATIFISLVSALLTRLFGKAQKDKSDRTALLFRICTGIGLYAIYGLIKGKLCCEEACLKEIFREGLTVVGLSSVISDALKRPNGTDSLVKALSSYANKRAETVEAKGESADAESPQAETADGGEKSDQTKEKQRSRENGKEKPPEKE